MSQIDEELQSAKYRDDLNRDLEHFINQYYPPYAERGISLADAFMMAKLRDIDLVNRDMLEVLQEIYPDTDKDDDK